MFLQNKEIFILLSLLNSIATHAYVYTFINETPITWKLQINRDNTIDQIPPITIPAGAIMDGTPPKELVVSMKKAPYFNLKIIEKPQENTTPYGDDSTFCLSKTVPFSIINTNLKLAEQFSGYAKARTYGSEKEPTYSIGTIPENLCTNITWTIKTVTGPGISCREADWEAYYNWEISINDKGTYLFTAQPTP